MTNVEKRLEAQSTVLALIGRYLCKNDPEFEKVLMGMLDSTFSNNEEVDETIKAEIRNLLNIKLD